jgi:hypothetical protein
VLHDGEPEACAAQCPRAGLVHPVEALEDAAQIGWRDSDAGVPHPHCKQVGVALDGYVYAAARIGVFDRVVEQVEQDLLDGCGVGPGERIALRLA